jgi:hypothetical protein
LFKAKAMEQLFGTIVGGIAIGCLKISIGLG